jgi:DinB superfamily
MTPAEVISNFTAIKNTLISLLETLTHEQLNQIPFPGSWTAGQLGEHVLKSYQAMDLSKMAAIPSKRPNDAKSSQIDSVFLDFSVKYQAPDFIVPSSTPISRSDLIAQLRETTDRIIDYAKTHELSFTSPDFEIIGFGDLTAQEWIHFLTAHGQRHVRQLRHILDKVADVG